MKKRVWSLLLAVLLVAQSLPVYAEEPADVNEPAVTVEEAAASVEKAAGIVEAADDAGTLEYGKSEDGEGLIQGGSLKFIERKTAASGGFRAYTAKADEEDAEWKEWETLVAPELQNRTKRIKINALSFKIHQDNISVWYYGLVNEHPEMFYCKTGFEWSYDPDTGYVDSIFPYYIDGYDAAHDALFEQKADEALSILSEDMTDVGKAIALHDYLVVNCEYDNKNLIVNSIPDPSYTAYGALVNRIAVCQGYALAYKYLLNRVGIDCYMVTSEEIDHAWNMVRLGGQLYHVDTTWDDPVWDNLGFAYHKYMFVSDDAFCTGGYGDRGAHDKHTTPHWEVQSNARPVTDKAASEIYDECVWVGMSRPIVPIEDRYYYVYYDNSAKTAGIYSSEKIYTAADKTVLDVSTKICDLGKWKVWGNDTSFYQNAYASLFLLKGRLYFNTATEIKSLDPKAADPSATVRSELIPDTANNGYIYGCSYGNGQLHYSMYKDPKDLNQNPNDPNAGEAPYLYESELTGIPATHMVTFNTNGGTTVFPQNIADGGNVAKPKDPAKTGYSFAGWYADEECETTPWDFDSNTVTANITLHAKWESIVKQHTVTFNANGGSAVGPETVTDGETVGKPVDPTKEGFVFDGWYADEALNTAWDFTKPVTENMTLYARWKEKEAVEPEKPEKPVEPTEPEKPEEPAEPTEPEKPEESVEPTEPEKPEESAEPTEPEKPEEPAGPEKPEAPIVEEDDHYKEYQGKKTSLSAVDASIADIKDKTYDGLPYTPDIKVTCQSGGKTVMLLEGTDYTVKYADNVNAGTGKVLVVGCGSYTGDLQQIFTIKPKTIKKCKVVAGGMSVNDKSGNLPVYVYDGDEILVENRDYTLEPKDIASSAGKKTVTITGKGNYDSATSKAVNVMVYDADKVLTAADFKLEYYEKEYIGKALKPAVQSVSGIDPQSYSVKYSNNTNVGVACVSIIGKGGYAGNVILNFKILPTTGTFHVNKDVPLKTVTYNGKRQKPKVKVTADAMLGGTSKTKTLKAGKDYIVTYKNNLHATVGSDTAYVIITGKGNYESIGTKMVPFKIVSQKLSKAKINGVENDYVVKYGKQTLLPGVDYTFVEYGERKSGKVQVKLSGKGDFTGNLAKTVKEK